MPIYEYECNGCRHRFEVIQKFSDPPKRSCPRCRSRARRLISAPGIHFKGSGWYVTDYARKGSSSPDSDTSSDSASGSDSSTDSSSGKSEAAKNESEPASKSARTPRRAARRASPRRRGGR